MSTRSWGSGPASSPRLLAALSPEEQDQLAGLLRTLLTDLGDVPSARAGTDNRDATT